MHFRLKLAMLSVCGALVLDPALGAESSFVLQSYTTCMKEAIDGKL